MVSNDVSKIQAYGQLNGVPQLFILWSSNTAGTNGTMAALQGDGTLVVKDSGGNIFFRTIADPTCGSGYSYTAKADVPGNDLWAGPGTVDSCKQMCDENPSCNTMVMDTTTIAGCWLKNKAENWNYNNSTREVYQKLNPSCKYVMNLQPDGNLCVYKYTDSVQSVTFPGVWCASTQYKQQDANPGWNVTKGKYGVSYMTTGQSLNVGEWIASDDGRMQLIMQPDGNLVLYGCKLQSTCSQQSYGMGGNATTNAIYQMDSVGNTNLLESIGVVDFNSVLHKYPLSRLGFGTGYSVI
jgi:hypothetical protein